MDLFKNMIFIILICRILFCIFWLLDILMLFSLGFWCVLSDFGLMIGESYEG